MKIYKFEYDITIKNLATNFKGVFEVERERDSYDFKVTDDLEKKIRRHFCHAIGEGHECVCHQPLKGTCTVTLIKPLSNYKVTINFNDNEK